MALNQQVFTTAGLSLLSAAEAGGTLTITKIVVGNGTAAVDADLYPLTALISLKANVTIVRETDLGGGKIIVSGQLNEATMTPGAAFSLRELGVMAKIGAGAEQLFSVSNVYADAPDTVTPGGTSTHGFDITILIARATSVTITIGDSDTVDMQNIPTDPTVGAGVYANRVGDVFQLKRLAPGTGMSIVETSDRITLGVKTITANLDLYVPPSHPAAPSPDVAFATLQAALDYLAPFIIPPDKTVTIHIYKGTFTSNVQITVNHPNARQIYITGEPRVDKSITAINNLDTTHKNVTVTPDATGLVVGQRCFIANSTGGWSGGCVITGISGSVVTVSTLKRDSRSTFTTADSGVGRRLSFFPTVMVLNDITQTIINISCPFGIGGLTYLTLVGGLQALQISGTAFVTSCSVWSAIVGITGDNLVLIGEFVATDCTNFGIVGSQVNAFDQVYVNACGVGIACQSAAIGSQRAGMDATKVYLAHNSTGIRVYGGAQFRGGSIVASSNDIFLTVQLNSVAAINYGGGYQSTLDNNGTDLSAQGSSYIEYTKNGGATPATVSPTAETIGNQNSLVHII